jgi:nicotinamide-nucleotide amidase
VITAEIVSIGTELLLGQILDSDAPFLAQRLSALGVNVFFRTTVGDNAVRVGDTLRQALSRADIVICIGGLGPTQDDLTRDAIAGALGVPLQRDPELVAHLTQWFARKGILQPKPSIFRQADVPVGGIPMPNSYGTAPGLWIEHGGKVVVALPGPPSEFEPMVEASLLPMLRRYLGTTEQVIVSRTLRLVGMGEAEAESQLLDLMKGSNPSVAPYAKQAEVQLRVTASAVTTDLANALIQPIVDEIKSRLGIAVYSDNDDDLETRVVMMLVERGESVATAESCTGGLLAGRLTGVPGSSEVFGTRWMRLVLFPTMLLPSWRPESARFRARRMASGSRVSRGRVVARMTSRLGWCLLALRIRMALILFARCILVRVRMSVCGVRSRRLGCYVRRFCVAAALLSNYSL